MIIAVSGEDLPGKTLRSITNALPVCKRILKHGRNMAVVLAITEGLTMNNDLVLGINEGLAVIAPDDAVGSHHAGRIVVRNITLFLSASRTYLWLILCQPLINEICLLLHNFTPICYLF